MRYRLSSAMFAALLASSALAADVDTLISGGTIYDGSGGAPYPGWVAV